MDEKNKILIGYKGVKYGLHKPKPNLTKPAAFGEDSSDDETVEAQVAKEQQRNLTASKVAAARAAAIAEDKTVYEYDTVYDEIQKNRDEPRKQDVQERKPKYIQALIQKAEIRKKEQDLAYERRLLKERKQDDHLYVHKEAFVTTAYKEKLIEDKFWIERERRLDAIEEAEDVTKRTDLSGFYQNLVTKNVAFASNRLASEARAEPDPILPDPTALPSTPSTSEKKPSSFEIPTSLPPDTQDLAKTSPSRVQPTQEAVMDRRKRRNDDQSIDSARERYLARKKQRTEIKPSV